MVVQKVLQFCSLVVLGIGEDLICQFLNTALVVGDCGDDFWQLFFKIFGDPLQVIIVLIKLIQIYFKIISIIMTIVLALFSYNPPDRGSIVYFVFFWTSASDLVFVIFEIIEERVKPVFESFLILDQMGANYFIFGFATRKRLALLECYAYCRLFSRDIFVNALGQGELEGGINLQD